MNKKFGIVKIFTFVGEKISILNKDDYSLVLCDSEILYESDSFEEISKIYETKYNPNRR